MKIKNLQKLIKKNKNIEKTINYGIIFLMFLLSYYFIFALNSIKFFPVSGDTAEFFSNTIFIDKFLPFKYNMGRALRFLPFQMLDYNILLIFPDSVNKLALTYQFLNIKFLILLISIYFITKYISQITKVKFDKFIVFSIMFLFSDYTFEIFYEPVFAEMIISTLLIIFTITYIKAQKEQKPLYYIISGIIMFYTTYCKETVIGIFITIAIAQLVFNRKKLTKLDKYFIYGIFANCAIFLLLYYILVVKDFNEEWIYMEVDKPKSIQKYLNYLSFIFYNNKFFYFLFPLWIYDFWKLIKKDKYFLIHTLSLCGFVWMISFFILCIEWGHHYYKLCLIVSLPSIYIVLNKIKYKKIVYAILFILILFSIKNKNANLKKFNDYNTNTEKSLGQLTQIYNSNKSICYPQKDNWEMYYLNNILNYIIKSKTNKMKKGQDDCDILVYTKYNYPNTLNFQYFSFLIKQK